MAIVRSRIGRGVYMADRSFRRQVRWTTLLVVVLCGSVVVFADAPGNPANPSQLFTWQNIISALVLVYHFGMLREQFATLKAQVEELKGRINSFDEKYAQKEDTGRRLDALEKV